MGRPSEIRLAEAKDIDIERERFYIRKPKGKGTYASPCWVVLLRPDYITHLERYLGEREIYLLKKNATSDYLFPNIRREAGYFSENAQRKLIAEVSHRSGVDFSMKTIRATGVNLFLMADINNLTAMSSQLRHSNLGVTQRHYADLQKGDVRRRLGDSYKDIRIPDYSERK